MKPNSPTHGRTQKPKFSTQELAIRGVVVIVMIFSATLLMLAFQDRQAMKDALPTLSGVIIASFSALGVVLWGNSRQQAGKGKAD